LPILSDDGWALISARRRRRRKKSDGKRRPGNGFFVQRTYHFHTYRSLVQPRTESAARIRELVDVIFSDLWAVEPDELQLLTSYIEKHPGTIGRTNGLGHDVLFHPGAT
jgi:hypothetical protein